MAMGKYPWIADAIMDWKVNTCTHKGDKINCRKCKLRGEACKKIFELATIISKKVQEEEED